METELTFEYVKLTIRRASLISADVKYANEGYSPICNPLTSHGMMKDRRECHMR